MYVSCIIHAQRCSVFTYMYIHCNTCTVFKIVFESVQQKHLDKTIFDQQVVNFVHKNITVPFYDL